MHKNRSESAVFGLVFWPLPVTEALYIFSSRASMTPEPFFSEPFRVFLTFAKGTKVLAVKEKKSSYFSDLLSFCVTYFGARRATLSIESEP